MSIPKLSFATVLFSSAMLCSQVVAQSGTATDAVEPAATPQVAQPAAPQVAQPAAADQAPDTDALKNKAGLVMGYNLARNWKSQNPDADYNQILEGIKAADKEDGVDKKSYVFGFQMMSRMKDENVGITAAQLEVGLKKAMAGEELGMSDEEVKMLMMSFGQMVEKNQRAAEKKILEDNKAEGVAYVAAQKAANPNLKELSDGVFYEVLTEGSGPKPGGNAVVSVNYTGMFTDGEVFDSSVKPLDGGPGEPAEFPVNRVIPGFTKSLMAMPVGSKWRVIIPGEQAYGESGSGGKIGPMKTLVFELELLDIVSDGTEAAGGGGMNFTPEMKAQLEAQMKKAMEAQGKK